MSDQADGLRQWVRARAEAGVGTATGTSPPGGRMRSAPLFLGVPDPAPGEFAKAARPEHRTRGRPALIPRRGVLATIVASWPLSRLVRPPSLREGF